MVIILFASFLLLGCINPNSESAPQNKCKNIEKLAESSFGETYIILRTSGDGNIGTCLLQKTDENKQLVFVYMNDPTIGQYHGEKVRELFESTEVSKKTGGADEIIFNDDGSAYAYLEGVYEGEDVQDIIFKKDNCLFELTVITDSAFYQKTKMISFAQTICK